MIQMTTKIIGKVMVIALCVSVLSCKGEHEHKYHTIKDKIEAETVSYSGGLTSEVYNETIKTVPVMEDDGTFLIPDRKSQITSFNCTECHSESLKSLQEQQVGKKAHWDIKLVHADAKTMNCATCHTGNDMDNLQSLTDQQIDFNYSYKLCSQCHQREFKDWKGGAHGKQLGGWAPPRVSNTCVNCHNPHAPAFEKRWPVRYNTQKVEERK